MWTLEAANELCRVLGDPTRVRLVAVLGHEPLTVAELTQVTGLAQSRVSTHLGRLREAGLVEVRREGTASLYSASSLESLPPDVGAVWAAIVGRLDDPLLDADRDRATALAAARATDETWSASVAGRMERHYSPGRTWQTAARGFLGLAELGEVLDVASGDGALSELVAPRTRRLVCLDVSARVVAAGSARLARYPQAEFVEADMHRLPFPPSSFDAVLLMNALPYASDPEQVVAEVARVLRPGGRLVGATVARHRHPQVVAPFGHVQPGIDPDVLAAWLEAADFRISLCEVTHTERRAPHFGVVTFHAVRRTDA